MKLFVSTFTNKLDQKGRVSVPASFRAALSEQSFVGVVLYPSFTAPAIEGCGVDFLEKLAASAESHFDLFSPEQDDLQTLIFSSSHQLAWDGEGRIVLPQELRDHANITQQVAFVGKGRTFQLWEPGAFQQHQAEARARALVQRPRLRIAEGGAA